MWNFGGHRFWPWKPTFFGQKWHSFLNVPRGGGRPAPLTLVHLGMKVWTLAKFRNKNVNFMAKTNSHQNITKVSEYRPPSPPYLENIPKKTIFLECFLKRPDDPKVSGWSAKCPTNPKSVLIISNMSWQKRLHNYGILQSKIGAEA